MVACSFVTLVAATALFNVVSALPTITSGPRVLAATLPDSMVKVTPSARLPMGGPSFLPVEQLSGVLGGIPAAAPLAVRDEAADVYDAIALDMIGGVRAEPLSSNNGIFVALAERQSRRVKDKNVSAQINAAANVSTTQTQISATATTTTSAVGSRRTKAVSTATAQSNIASQCVGSEGNDTYISSLFYYGGAGTTVYLCPNARISLTNAIFFTAANQTLATQGLPTDSTRATLVVTGQDQTCAIYALYGEGFDYVTLRNVIIDGARATLGIYPQGIALIEMGGNSVGQQVINVKAFEPRSWSTLHLIEGDSVGSSHRCDSMKILNNEIGPAGHAPSGAQQFRERDSTGTYPPGQWADGISLACKNSLVSGNTVIDATDGGIVIFGAPGSTITKNKIVANDRQLLGGINLVDWSPFSGSFVGTTVSGNSIQAQNSMIKVGIAIGGLTWGVDNRTAARTYGGVIQNNQFSAAWNGYFGYAIGIAGHENATISGNSGRLANYGGVMSASCFPQFPLLPAQAFVADQWTTPGVKFQNGFSFSTLVLLICSGPGAITKRFSLW